MTQAAVKRLTQVCNGFVDERTVVVGIAVLLLVPDRNTEVTLAYRGADSTFD